MSEHTTKKKVTVSLDARLLAFIDRAAKRHGSRSGAIEHVLWEWHQQQLSKALDEETERYYRSLSADDKQEDREWSRLSRANAERLWE